MNRSSPEREGWEALLGNGTANAKGQRPEKAQSGQGVSGSRCLERRVYCSNCRGRWWW